MAAAITPLSAINQYIFWTSNKPKSFNYETEQGNTYDIFKATVTPANASYPDLKWTSSNEKVVSVNAASGAVTIKGIGTATISCISVDNNRVKATCKITVNKTAVKKIIVTRGEETLTSETVLNMKVNDTDDTIRVSFDPVNASFKTLTWKSSNTKVVTAENGVLIAKGKGTATVTVTAKDNSRAKLSFKVKVS